jgi:hypothetical protein
MTVTVKGLCGISATMLKDSINKKGNRFRSYELTFPRFILAELNTHCMLEKNTASSRAIPVESMLKLIEESPAMPVSWGMNNPGMVSRELLSEEATELAKSVWLESAKSAVSFSRKLGDKNGINVHKQIANRTTEAYQMSKTVFSGTEFSNLFWLRNHPDAQPEFQELARVMFECGELSVPTLLKPGEWHLPYVKLLDGKYYSGDTEVDLETAKKISASCCAQVSYRKLNDSIEQAQKVFDMLNLESDTQPAHASPICHQGTPMQETDICCNVNLPENIYTWEKGITHVRRDFSLWSGKLKGWVQYRQLFDNEAKWD